MKVVFTQDALRDLDEILQYISTNYPGVYGPFENESQCPVYRGTFVGCYTYIFRGIAGIGKIYLAFREKN